MSAMMPLMRVLEQGGKFIQCVKHGVEMSGLNAPDRRAPPLKALNKDDKRQLEQVVRVLKSTIDDIDGRSVTMTDLLTRDEYKALAAKLTLPTNAFIDGSYRAGTIGRDLLKR
jgi:hypothetical protein